MVGEMVTELVSEGGGEMVRDTPRHRPCPPRPHAWYQRGVALPHLRAWRLYAVLGQRELAARSGVSVSMVREVECGRRRASPALAGKLADALGCERRHLAHEAPPVSG